MMISLQVLRAIAFVHLLFGIILGDNNTRSYQLREKDIVLAKLDGLFTFNVTYTSANKTGTISFDLPPAPELTVTGSQTDKSTGFSFVPITIEQDKPQLTDVTFVFVKDVKSSVYIQNVRVSFNAPDEKKKKIHTVEWTDKTVLATNSSFAYICSQIELTNKTNVFEVANARLQPFDLQQENFGTDELCPKDLKPTTTTLAPTPAPKFLGWTVKSDGFGCIRMVGNVSLHITYNTEGSSNLSVRVQVPENAVVTPNSTCNFDKKTGRVKDEQVLQLKFPVNQNDWFLMFNFTNDTKITHDKDGTIVQAYAVQLDYTIDAKTFVNASDIGRSLSIGNAVNKTSGEGALKMFSADTTHQYRCNNKEKTIVAKELTVSTYALKAEAFLNNSTKFLDAERICSADEEAESSDLVPIITGAALAALVLFVLIAYLIGRARAKQSTYETI